MAIKFALSKAYDQLKWRFIDRVLLLFDVEAHFVKLVMFCAESVTF